MVETVDLIFVDGCGLTEIIAKVSLLNPYEVKDKDIFTINLYDKKLPAIFWRDTKGNGKISILYGDNLPRQELRGYLERVNNFSVLKELL